ncbi:hypothetical protein SE23_15030 [Vibrio sinaloensis]|nr:hypothetical protein SE23_15030 [Vibrio sinaloensis]
MNHSQITLYSARGSNSSQRVEWALNYKNIDYQRVEVLSEELTSSYLEINPFGIYEIDFYTEHLQYLRSHSSIADSEPL